MVHTSQKATTSAVETHGEHRSGTNQGGKGVKAGAVPGGASSLPVYAQGMMDSRSGIGQSIFVASQLPSVDELLEDMDSGEGKERGVDRAKRKTLDNWATEMERLDAKKRNMDEAQEKENEMDTSSEFSKSEAGSQMGDG